MNKMKKNKENAKQLVDRPVVAVKLHREIKQYAALSYANTYGT